MHALSQPALIALFLGAAALVWWAGVHLTRATSVLDDRFGLGQAIGGTVLLAVVTNLPEIAIVSSAAMTGRFDVAVGNILGGIAIQTVVLSALDAFGNRGTIPLSRRAASPQLLMEGVLVIVVLAIALLAHALPESFVAWRVPPGGATILLAWFATLWLLRKLRSGESGTSRDKSSPAATRRAALMFAFTALVTLGAGVLLESSGSALAEQWGLEGALFGATILAAATALPEVATGLAAMRDKQYTLAVSDILGGNAFLPVLFLPAALIAGKPLLPSAQATDLYLAALGILLTAIFLGGMILKPRRKHAGMGPDAWLLVAVYAVGVCGLFAIR